MVQCHDKSPFADYECQSCGGISHIHKTQLPANYQELEWRSICKRCGAVLVLPKPTAWIGEEEKDYAGS